MAGRRSDGDESPLVRAAGQARTVAELAGLLRALRRREGRQEGAPPLTYRELAAKTGWSRGVFGEYFGGHILAPTDRFDILIRLLGASPAEQRALATARDRVEEQRRPPARTAGPAVARQLPPVPAGFVGRLAQLAELDALAGPDRHGPGAPVVVLSGPAGAGKSTLAAQWAHRVRGAGWPPSRPRSARSSRGARGCRWRSPWWRRGPRPTPASPWWRSPVSWPGPGGG